MATSIENKSVLVTGANRGIGRELVEEALRRGAKRVYAAARHPHVHADPRVRPLILDVTDAVQVQAAGSKRRVARRPRQQRRHRPLRRLDRPAILEQHFAVNLFGPYGSRGRSCRCSRARRERSSTTCQ